MENKHITIDGISYPLSQASHDEKVFIARYAKFLNKVGKFSRLNKEALEAKIKDHYKFVCEAAGKTKPAKTEAPVVKP